MRDIGEQVPYDQSMNPRLKYEDEAYTSYESLSNAWKTLTMNLLRMEYCTSGIYLFRAIFSSYKFQLLSGCVLGLGASITSYANAYVVYVGLGVFKDFENKSHDKYQIYYDLAKITIGIAISSFIYSTIESIQANYMFVIGARIGNGLRYMLYEKMMRKSSEREALFTQGEITNIIQVDASNFELLGVNFGQLVTLPIEIFIGYAGLYLMMDFAALPAIGVLIISVILNVILSNMYDTLKVKYMEKKDERAKIMIELFENISFIKLSCLEHAYISKCIPKKEDEIRVISDLFNRYVYSNIFNELTPILLVFIINVSYICTFGSLSIQKVFTGLIIINVFKRNLRLMPEVMVFMVDSAVSARRISFYLFSEEIDDSYITYIDPIPKPGSDAGPKVAITRDAIDLKDGQFYWKDEVRLNIMLTFKKKVFGQDDKKKTKTYEKLNDRITATNIKDSISKSSRNSNELVNITKLEKRSSYQGMYHPLVDNIYDPVHPDAEICKDIDCADLNIKAGSKVAVVGLVGSGKSSFLSSLLGELYALPATRLYRPKTIAYTSQTPWMIGGSIRENIIVGQPFDDRRFELAIQGSCMRDDLQQLPLGEHTHIGSKGVGLSGGQKARVAIARALFSDADLYLFDDPISALDINVAKRVMEVGIFGQLKDKTVIVATHALGYLQYFDIIILLDKGHIKFHGNFSQYNKSSFKNNLEAISQAEKSEVRDIMHNPSIIETLKINPSAALDCSTIL